MHSPPQSLTAAASAAAAAAVAAATATVRSGKQSRKEILRKADAKSDAAGKDGILVGTYTDAPPSPPPASAPAAAAEPLLAAPPPPPKAKAVEVQERESWDDESNPPSARGVGAAGDLAAASSTGSKGESPFAAHSGRKVYTRDFMMRVRDKLPKQEAPPGLTAVSGGGVMRLWGQSPAVTCKELLQYTTAAALPMDV